MPSISRSSLNGGQGEQNRRAWSSLPQELVELIWSKLDLSDRLSFASTCRWWRSVAAAGETPQLPWLLLFDIEPTRPVSEFRLFSISEQRTFSVNFLTARHVPCCGVQGSWLILMDTKLSNQNPRRSCLYNPFLGTRIALPDGPDIDGFVLKAAISSFPTKENMSRGNCVAAAVDHTGQLWTCQLSDGAWRQSADHVEHNRHHQYSDILFYREKLWAIDTGNSIFMLDVDGRRKKNVAKIRGFRGSIGRFLVESCGELLPVLRFASKFVVFQLDATGKKWSRVKTLGERALFVGTECSRSLVASEFKGLDANCIYFADGNLCLPGWQGPTNSSPGYPRISKFCLEDGQIEIFCDLKDFGLDATIFRPIWIHQKFRV